MANTNIFLGSGSSVTFVPEVDIYLKPAALTALSLSSGATTNESKVITYASNTNVVAGMAITGTGIPNGTLIATVDSATQATLDTAATATGSGLSLTATNIKKLNLHSDFTSRFDLVDDLYIGCVLEFYDAGTLTSTHRITSNDSTTLSFHPALGHPSTFTLSTADDYFRLKGYGAPCPANSGSSNLKHLNADYWMGIVESLTFPSVEVEFKQQNLFVGGSRNFTYQYKGIETAGNASVNIVANHGAWLYYFFGKCSAITATLDASTNPASDFQGGGGNKYFLNGTSVTDTGPLFYRSIDNGMVPPVLRGQDTFGDLDHLTEPSGTTTISNPITYTFAEQDGDDLPSFAMEQVFSKLPSTNTYSTNTDASADEDTNFVLIATGNRVNTLTMTANENEELKMTMDCMPFNQPLRSKLLANYKLYFDHEQHAY